MCVCEFKHAACVFVSLSMGACVFVEGMCVFEECGGLEATP